jgi:hypothetical protein
MRQKNFHLGPDLIGALCLTLTSAQPCEGELKYNFGKVATIKENFRTVCLDWHWNGLRFIVTTYGLIGSGRAMNSPWNLSSHWSRIWTKLFL